MSKKEEKKIIDEINYIAVTRKILDSGVYIVPPGDDLKTATQWCFSLPKCDTSLGYQTPICMRGKVDKKWYNLYCISMVSGDPVFVLFEEYMTSTICDGSWAISIQTRPSYRCYYKDVMEYRVRKPIEQPIAIEVK